MDQLIMEAYDNAKSNDFFAITLTLEALIKQNYPRGDYRREITTGQVRRVLEAKSLDYILIQPLAASDVHRSCSFQQHQRPVP